jgi:phage baseplate assembly protein gpV
MSAQTPRRLVIDGCALDSVEGFVTLGGKKYQVIGLDSIEKTNKPYKTVVQILAEVDALVPELGSEALVEIEFKGVKRTIKECILWAAEENGEQSVAGKDKIERMQVWMLELRPKLYTLSQDYRSDLYEGDCGEVLGELKKSMGITCKMDAGLGKGEKRVVGRYKQCGLDFWDQMISNINAQYYFKDGVLQVVQKCNGGSKHTIKEREICGFTTCAKSAVGKIKVSLHQRDKSLKHEELSANVTKCKSVYEEDGVCDKKRHLQLQEYMKLQNNTVYYAHVVNHSDVSVGDSVKLDVRRKLKGDYYVLGVHHVLSLVGAKWRCVSKLSLSKNPDAHLLYQGSTEDHLHRAVIVNKKDEKNGEIVVDNTGKVYINYLWQKSKVKVLAYVGMQSCGGDGRGIVSLPRVGDEVVVKCIDGDLAQPVILAVITSVTNPVPLQLPKESTVTRIRTRAVGETKKEYKPNEILLDDAKEKERVCLTAARDYNLHVVHDCNEHIGGKQLIEVCDDRTTIVKKEKDALAHDVLKIENGNLTTELNGKGAVCKAYVKDGKMLEQVDNGEHRIWIKSGDRYLVVDKGADNTKVGGAKTVEADSVTIKCGGSKITMTKSGITIDSSSISISGNSVSIAAKGKLNLKGMNVDVNGTAGATVNGATVAVAAKAKLDLSASGMASLSASGITKVSGAMLKLN